MSDKKKKGPVKKNTIKSKTAAVAVVRKEVNEKKVDVAVTKKVAPAIVEEIVLETPFPDPILEARVQALRRAEAPVQPWMNPARVEAAAKKEQGWVARVLSWFAVK